MARGKKKEELSLEEKLEQALVPVEEQPYGVPGNWCWTKIKYGFDVTSSKRIHKSDWLDNGIPFYRTRELVKLSNNGFVDNELFISNELYSTLIRDFGRPEVGDVLISGVGTIGVPYVVDGEEKFYFKDGNVIWFKNKNVFDAKYIFYLYKSLFMENQIYGMSAGTTVDTYTIVNANETVLPLPPLEEQQRIIDCIESLFAKLDEAKEKARAVVDDFELRKSAILHKAFTGELTEKWRKKRNINILDWKQKTIKDVCNDIKVGIVIKPTQYYTEPDNGVAAFRSANVREGYIEDENWVYINWTGQQENKRSEVHTGDVLVVRSGNPGTACVVTEEYDGFNAIDIIIAVPDKSQIDPKYLCYYTNSPEGKGLVRENKRGMALPHFNVGGYSKLPIKIPSLEEQQEIVRIIEMQMSKEQKSKEIVQSIVDEIDVMKKSILAKAFRGELGTNNPDEESVIELLKTVLMES